MIRNEEVKAKMEQIKGTLLEASEENRKRNVAISAIRLCDKEDNQYFIINRRLMRKLINLIYDIIDIYEKE